MTSGGLRAGRKSSRGTFCAEAAEDELAFAKHTFAEQSRDRAGDVVPFDVFDVAAAVADEMVVLNAFGVKAGGAAFDGHFTHEAGLDEIAQIVISRGAGGAGVQTVDGFENFRGGRMTVLPGQKRHDGVALRGAAKAVGVQRASDDFGVRKQIRLYLICELVQNLPPV